MKTIEEFLSDLRRRDVNLWLDGEDLCYKAPAKTLTPALRQELKDRKAEILTFLYNANRDTRSNLPPILSSLRDKDIPLSTFAQQRLWFLDQLEPGNSAYNMFLAYRLTGQINITALEQSLNEIIRRHEVLRSTFSSVNGQPSQAIAPHQALNLPIIDLQEHPETKREAFAQQIATEEAKQPFDLADDPLFRVKLLRLAEADGMLLLNMHHIISDGWSFDIFFQELAALYTAFSTNKPSLLPELPIQYADFAYWQRKWQGEALESQLSYWKQQLSGSLPILQLPTDHPRPPVQSYRGAYQSLKLSLKLTESLKAQSQQEGVTLFMTLLAAFQILLCRYSGQEDIIVGTPIAGRNQVETEGLIGLFVNSLAIRINLSGNPSFRQLLSQFREVTLGAIDHQDLPLEKLIQELKPERDLSRSPLFQVMFAFQNTPSQHWELPGLTITPLEVHSGTSKFDLTLALEETSEGIKGGIEYNTDLFEVATITRMVGHFQTLLEGIVANPEQHLWNLPLLTAPEQHQLLVEWNNTAKDYSQNQCLHQLFEEQVERAPDTVAVVFEEEQLTYRELNARANQLAHYLQSLGVGPEGLVGICVERSLEMVIGLLGVLKAGGVYVPLDPAYPRERVTYVLQDAGALVLVTQKSLLENLPESGARLVCLDAHWKEIAQHKKDNPNSLVKPDNLAYVIYTSGSTGQPKGVQIPHSAVVNFLTSMSVSPGLEASDILLAVTTVSFDIAVLEIFLPLTVGASSVLVSREVASDGRQLSAILSRTGATVMQATPATWRMLLGAGWIGSSNLKILCGGETLSRELANQLLSRCASLWNMYGPTETTVWSAVSQVKAGDESMLMGRAIDNTQFYILDSHLQPVPVGVRGELHIGGAGLAVGYLNRAELTAQKFILNPFEPTGREAKLSGRESRLYKTGDLARYLSDGKIEFLGRIDEQVKIRGFRIELGEIEAVLSQHPGVKQAAIAACDNTLSGDKRLVAYIVLHPELSPTVNDLRSYLKEKLPNYMVPSTFVMLDELPVTPNGKIDRRALPSPDFDRLELDTTFAAPSDVLERQVAEIWEKVLGIKPIGIKDNFFDIGGHSLLAVLLFAQIEKVFGKNLPLATLFQAPTIEQLANILRSRGWTAPWRSLVAIQPRGSKLPFFCVHGLGGGLMNYYNLARHLHSEQPFYGLQALGLDGKQTPHTRVEDMAAHYIQEIRTVQPEGPYLLGGHCLGGVVAFEMAQQLLAQGEKVGLVALIDSLSPVLAAKNPPFSYRIYVLLVNFFKVSFSEKLNYILERIQWRIQKISQKTSDKFYRWFGRGLTERVPDPYYVIETVHKQAFKNYSPQVCPGRMIVFRPEEMDANRYGDPLQLGWGELATGELEIQDVPGNHTTAIVQESHLEVLAAKLQASLDSVEATAEQLANIRFTEKYTIFAASFDVLERQLIEIWEKVLGIKPIGVRDNFFDLGGHSLIAVRLFAQIHKKFGKNLPLAILFQAPTIEQLANILRLEGELAPWSSLVPIQLEGELAPWSSLVPIQSGGSRRPFFGVHTNDGSVLFYRHLVRYLDPEQPFYGLQAPDIDGKQALLFRIEDKAAHYIKEIRTLQPEGPYLLGGFCVGGEIAFEMAQQLVSQGQQVVLLALFDSVAPFPLSLRYRVYLHLGYFSLLKSKEKLIYILTGFKRRIKPLFKTIQKIFHKFYPSIGRFDTGNLPLKFSPYTPQVYPGKITLFRASQQSPITYHLPDLNWGKFAIEGVEIHDIPGAHTDIVLCEPSVRILAEKLSICLDEAQQTNVKELGFPNLAASENFKEMSS